MRLSKALFAGVMAAGLFCADVSLQALDSPALSLARQLNEAFIEVADKVSPSVVVIEITEKPGQNDDESGSWWDFLPPEDRPRHRRQRSRPVQAEGSGIIITADGYILTNNHVVENASRILVRLKDGRAFTGEVKGTDAASDIAVIKIKATGLNAATLGDSDGTRVGEFVLAIGAPFTLSYSVTFGHVSAKGRSALFENVAYSDQDFIQTDASINPGNSGGPLVNLYGEVIAINTMIEGMNTGIGFAIPINLAKRVKDHLISEGRYTRAWIGVHIEGLKDFTSYRELEPELAPDVDSGVVITGIRADGPAAKSGLRAGDIILAVENKKVETARQLQDAISVETPGRVLTLDVARGKQRLALKVQTAGVPDDLVSSPTESAPVSPGAPESPMFGLTLGALTKDLAERYGLNATGGVVVTAVQRDSPADEQRIQVGDVITRVNRHPVANLRQFRQALRSADAKKGILLDIFSRGSAKMLILKDPSE
jgi:serine protease Do